MMLEVAAGHSFDDGQRRLLRISLSDIDSEYWMIPCFPIHNYLTTDVVPLYSVFERVSFVAAMQT
jgi:hypothetical protein